MDEVIIIGGGLAGSEAAWQLAERGVPVRLYEMRPAHSSPAHSTAELAELVCSNSFKSKELPSAAATLKKELALMGCFLLRLASEHCVEAGQALAVEREAFSRAVTASIKGHPRITLVREELASLGQLPASELIVATGPLTSPALAQELALLLGQEYLAFFDAAAPIVEAESLDMTQLVRQSRFDKGEGVYLNALLTCEQYDTLITELTGAERVQMRDFEKRELFSACQPIEEVARSGPDALRFGALKPIGLNNPQTGRRPYAAVQLRAENTQQSAWNLVGFQTNLTFAEQERVLRLIPGLEQVHILRHGVMHRNTFINAPAVLGPGFELPAGHVQAVPRSRQTGHAPAVLPSSQAEHAQAAPQSSQAEQEHAQAVLSDGPAAHTHHRLRFAGQITGTEGYTEAIASGLFAALGTYAQLCGAKPVQLPAQSTFGALVAYATNPETKHYQPMHVNYGLMPELPTRVRGKRERYETYSQRALAATQAFIAARPELFAL